jgi:hypothetical protein
VSSSWLLELYTSGAVVNVNVNEAGGRVNRETCMKVGVSLIEIWSARPGLWQCAILI